MVEWLECLTFVQKVAEFESHSGRDSLTVHPAVNGYLTINEEGLRCPKERLGHCLSHVIAQDTMGL